MGSAPKKDLNLYELLQVDRDAHPTIIRYAYRFLAAQYHPDNSESGDADKFRIITEAWRTLSDEGKRAAYDMSLGTKEQARGSSQPSGGAAPRAGGAKDPPKDYGMKFTKQGISFNEIELRLAILNILLSQRKKKPQTGGASAKMMMDILDMNDMAEMEFAIWYLRESGYIEMGDRLFMISVKGVDYIVDQLSKTTILADKKTEEKIRKMGEGSGSSSNLPATLQR
jgi:curved DNA-binding protein CbpA